MEHHQQNLKTMAANKAEDRAYRARRAAAIRRCDKNGSGEKHVTAYIRRQFWFKEPIAAVKAEKALKPVHVVIVKKGCQPGPNGKPCAPKSPKKFVGPAMVNFKHSGEVAKKVVKPKAVKKAAPTCVITSKMNNVERL
jgi:hypothetical protein